MSSPRKRLGGLPAGTVIAGRYHIGRRLGAGGMGTVYEVTDVRVGRQRALKILELGGPGLAERFEGEVKLTAHVKSAFVVDILDAGIEAALGVPYLVMELLHGEDLSHRLARIGHFPHAEALGYLTDVARGLDAIHRRRIVHRDLKPANLFLEQGEDNVRNVRILDFGVAIFEGTGEVSGVAGTPAYMAPEQLLGLGVSIASDVFAFGMVTFALLVGKPYWNKEAAQNEKVSEFAVIARHGPPEPASIRAMHAGVTLPPAFDDWFAQATAAAPQRRFRNARDALRALYIAFDREPPAEAFAPDPVPREDEPTEGHTVTGEVVYATTIEISRRAPSGETESRPPTHAGEQPGGTVLAPGGQSIRRNTSNGAPEPTARFWRARWSPLAQGVRQNQGCVLIVLAALGGATYIAVDRIGNSPLDPPDSVLACPILEASGVEEPAGWLGAAAASVLCERARIVLGGRTARTRLPAELLSLPSGPTDDFPADVFAGPDSRVRSLEAARRSAAAYFDGRVTKDGAGFRITIRLHDAAGAELSQAEGTGRALFEAARQAMQPFIDSHWWLGSPWLPTASELDPVVSDFSRARTPAAALALLDLSLAMNHNAGGVAEECARLEEHGGDIAEMAPGERFRCAHHLGEPLPEVNLGDGGTSAGAIAARARIDHMVKHGDERAVAEEIERLLEAEPSKWGRSVLASTASCLLQGSDSERALEMAQRAVQAEPKNPTGETCPPWAQFASLTRGTRRAMSAMRAMQAWVPWESYGWRFEAEEPGGTTNAVAYARRAYVLSPFDMDIVAVLADKLLANGTREEVRLIAMALALGNRPIHRVTSELLLVRVEASEARFGAALRRAERAMQRAPDDAGWVHTQRLEIAWRALEIARILDRAQQTADLIVEQFLDPEPPPLDATGLQVPMRIPAICASASPSVAVRCFDRFRGLRDKLSGGIRPETNQFTEGAERYVRGDYVGAADAFRKLLDQPEPFSAMLAEPMLDAFQKAGEPYSVELLEAKLPDPAAEFHGASLAVVLRAKRAEQRGQRKLALELAKQVIDAWPATDEVVPAFQEMLELRQRLE